MSPLGELENKSIYIIREAYSYFREIAVLDFFRKQPYSIEKIYKSYK